MNLKKLDLYGFKSFMRKLDIRFSDGITVIVGPNGCGKTNVTDAVRWVLGESNARTLRGAKMEDLIFNGTRDYKPLNVAEVELTVDNSSGILPVDFAEVTVTRRVYRNGESEFLINKVPGRLRDIHELFMDTGLGSRAYSVIEREMVEMVLADQPEKRRELIEEAAGIHKYKIRERQARRKLESTDDDLMRISDVLREVERQVRSLKRQVGAARRFQEVRDRLRELEVRIALVDLAGLESEAERRRESLSQHATEREGAAAKVAALETDLETHRARAADEEKQLVAAQGDVDRALDAARQAEAQSLVRRERREALRARVARLAEEHEELERRLKEGASARQALEADRGEHQGRLGELRAKLDAEEQSLAEAGTDLERRRDALAGARESTEEQGRELARLREELVNLEARAAHFDERREALAAEEEGVAGERVEAESAEGKATERLAALRAEVEAVEGDVRDTTARLEELDAARESARDQEGTVRSEAEAARSARELLESLQAAHEGYGQGARSLLEHGSLVRALADSVRPARTDLLPALDAALEGVIDLVVARSGREARQAVERLRSGEGRATIVHVEGFLAGVQTRGKYAIPSDPAILGTARSFLDVEGELSVVLDDLLSRTLIVESLDDALRFAEQPESRGFRFVTRDGDWAEHPGIVHGGSRRAEDGSRLLGRAARVAELSRRVVDGEGRLEAARRAILDIERDRDEQSERLVELRTELREKRELLVAEERATERARAGLETLEARRGVLRSELRDVETSRDAVGNEIGARREAIRKADAARQERLEEWRLREGELVDSTELRDRRRVGCHELRLQWERLQGETERTRLEMSRLEESARADEEGLARRAEDLTRTEQAIRDLDAEIEVVQEEGARYAGELGEQKTRRDGIAAGRTEVLETLRGIEKERARWAVLRDESAELLHQGELELQRIESSREESLGRVERELEVNLALPGAREAHGDLLSADPSLVEEARRERDTLRRQSDRLGAVNLVALDQYEREARREEFLRSQKEDLETAREKLRRTIRKINRTARTRFLSTLEEVRTNFQHTFGTLFEGGQADIRLSGDEDPLHAPIEIFARPRGKRLSNISLLSSGERSLTAVAFLFAIYLVKPSPFCILDEVDAPLDDANIGRFLSMLREVAARNTQFVMITHNKRTMEVADYLYGVTMQEPGISQLVSVRLGAEEPEGGNGADVVEGNGAAGEEPSLVAEASA